MVGGGSVGQQHGIEVIHVLQSAAHGLAGLQQVPGQHQCALDVGAASAVAVAHSDPAVQPGADDVLQRADIGGTVGCVVDIIPPRGVGLGIAAERDDLHQPLVALLSAGLGGKGVDKALGGPLGLGQPGLVAVASMSFVLLLATDGAVVHTVGHVQHQHHGAVGGLAGDGGQVLGGLDLERDLKLILHHGSGHALGDLQDGVAGLFCGLGHAVAVLLKVPRAACIYDLGGTVVPVLHPGRKGGAGQEAQYHHQRQHQGQGSLHSLGHHISFSSLKRVNIASAGRA